MTNCTGTPAEQWLERYIQGTLPELQQQEFEEHYFDCPVCLAQLEALQAVKLQLGSQPLKMPKAPIPWPTRIAVFGAIAAMLLIGFLGYRTFLRRPEVPAVAVVPKAASPQEPSRPAQPPLASTEFSQLADLTLPAYRASSLRGPDEDSIFAAGMKAYASADCHRVVDTLSRVGTKDDNALAAQFYSGACQMHEGNLAAASAALRKVADAGDSPQQEAAWYYLAQIALARNDAVAARHFLGSTIALHGDFERRARAELANLAAAVAGK